jgi:hypothetical protein
MRRAGSCSAPSSELSKNQPSWVDACVQALDEEPGETIVDPRAIIFAKDEPGLALRIPDDVLPISSGSGEEQRPL